MGNIYTLADNGTTKARQNAIIVNGKGTDLSDKKAIKGRAKRKTITQIMMLNLIDIAKENGNTEFEKSYWNTYHCQSQLIIADGRSFGNYCKNRFCTLCCANRKADMINRYYPVLKEWEKPYFLTLTVKACKAEQLNAYLKVMLKTFQLITSKYRKQYQRVNGKKLIGVKSLESNFNPRLKTYNPHFHVIVKEKWMAETIKAEWVKRSKKGYAAHWCQKIKPISNLETGLIEVIKYGSKIFTEPDLKKKTKTRDTAFIYLKALDTILGAMKNKRIFDRFGFNSPELDENFFTPAKLLTEYSKWEYIINENNWINTLTGEIMTDYELPPYLQSIIENNINTSLS